MHWLRVTLLSQKYNGINTIIEDTMFVIVNIEKKLLEIYCISGKVHNIHVLPIAMVLVTQGAARYFYMMKTLQLCVLSIWKNKVNDIFFLHIPRYTLPTNINLPRSPVQITNPKSM